MYEPLRSPLRLALALTAVVVVVSMGGSHAHAQNALAWTCPHGHVYTVALTDVSESVGSCIPFATGDGVAFADPGPSFYVSGVVARADIGSVALVQGFAGTATCYVTATLKPRWTVSISPALTCSVTLVAQDRSWSYIQTTVESDGGSALSQALPPAAALGISHYCTGGRPYSEETDGYGPISNQEVTVVGGSGHTVVPFVNMAHVDCRHGAGFGDDTAEAYVSTGARIVAISTPCGYHSWVTPGTWSW